MRRVGRGAPLLAKTMGRGGGRHSPKWGDARLTFEHDHNVITEAVTQGPEAMSARMKTKHPFPHGGGRIAGADRCGAAPPSQAQWPHAPPGPDLGESKR